ncbi:MAG: transglutaminase domain-containing protein [Planctomycetia bacterium]
MATLYWDPDGIPGNNNVATGAGLGGSGTWSNAPIACWFNLATKQNVAWTNAAGDVAVFLGATQQAVSVAGSVTCAVATFQSSFIELKSAPTQPGSLEIAPSGMSITVATGMPATISIPITGSGTLSKGGEGLLVLTANETYTGATTVLAGTLDVRGNLASHVTASGGTVAGLVFFDPDLAAAVRETLGMSVDTVLTPSKVAGLSALTVDGNKISDLTGLNPANTPNLAALSLLPGDFSAKPAGLMSLAPLAGLAKLKTLAIQHVGLTDAVLETLPALPALDTLDVRFNSIGVIPANVAGLPGLSTLLVHGNPSLADSPRAGLKNLQGRPVDVDVAADGPETAATVADLAASLYYLPQKMLEYVTNTVAFQPYVGLMKGRLATLQTKAGNDWDTNALLAGLFNAAGIETRFVSGSIKVTDKQVMDYVGARDVTAAANILSKAGIAGGIGTLTHAWMEASVRLPGAAAEAWLPLDASWKFRDFRPGVAGILENVPFSTVETDYLTNPSWQTKTTAEYYESKVATWLAANRPGVTTADVAYDGPIRQQSFPKLPGGLPYQGDCTISQMLTRTFSR